MAPQNNDNRAVILEQALTRFVDECLQGDKPDIDEFVRQYPQCEAQLKRRIRDLKEIDFLFDSLIRADEIEFGATVAPQDLVGQKLASFDVERVIGQGGMGVVYLALDSKLDRHVAIKSMPAGLLSSSKAQARFKSEAKLLASLSHPNIAVIYDIIEDQEGASYLVLEYVPGETLAEKIACAPLELEDALSIGDQIAEAVSAAHKKGIVHRDLKPSNIKITPEGRVKVLDFGLAKVYDRDSEVSRTAAIQPGRVIGTPAYMSPEQAQGKDTDHRTDIWSFGCIMFEILTGRHPFECETAKDTLESIIENKPDWNLLSESASTNIRALLKRCLDKDPNRRLEDISDAAKEIHETLSKPSMAPSAKLLRIVMIVVVTIIIFGLSALVLLFTSHEQYPTKNKQAYAYFRRGNDYSSRAYQDKNDLKIAKEMYEKAIGLDDKFALAYAWLSHTHSGMFFFRHDRTKECLAKAKEAVDKALLLDPDLPEAHWALGVYYYWGFSDYISALYELEIAHKSQPNNNRILATIGHVKTRQGEFEDALENYKIAYKLNPESNTIAGCLANAFERLGQYSEAEHYYKLCTSLAPEDHDKPYVDWANLYLVWEGNTEKARKVLEQALQYLDLAKSPGIVNLLIRLDIYDKNYQGALDRLASKPPPSNYMRYLDALRYAQIYGCMKDKKSAEIHYERAVGILESQIEEDPNNARFYSALGIAHAGLGQREKAIYYGEYAKKLMPISKDALSGPGRVRDLAHIYVMVDKYDAAFEQIKYLLSIPGALSIPLLQLDPAWMPLRNRLRFKKLLESYK